MPNETIHEIPRDKIRPGENVRQTAEEIEELTASLTWLGQQVPLIVTPDPDNPGSFICIDGWRRWLASDPAGLKVLKAVICEKAPSQEDLLILQANLALHCSKLSNWDLSSACCNLLTARPDWRQKDVAKALSIDDSMVTRLCSFTKGTQKVQDAYRQGLITPKDCHEIVQWPRDEQDVVLEQRLAGATHDSLVTARKKRKASAADVARASRIRLEFPSGTSVTVSGAAMSLEELASVLADALKSVKRGIAERLDARTLQALLSQKAKAGN